MRPMCWSRCCSMSCTGPRNEIADPKKLATFKTFLLDEAWLFIKNETIRNYVVQAQKTWRKHNAAMILATQSIKELEESGMLQIVSESCPTKIFLANPEMNREVYREAFHLNDTELDLIAGLVPPGQMLIRKAQTSKKVQLNVDSVSHWMATNNARDNLKKRDYFERFGIADGLRRLAEDFPFRPRTLAVTATPNPEGARMNRKLSSSPGLPWLFPSCRRAGCVGTHCAVPLAGHRSHPREAEVHDAHRGSATEKIMEAATGDKDFWIVDVVGNFCFVHPAKPASAPTSTSSPTRATSTASRLQDISGHIRRRRT
jgi:hypothetical protein